MEEVSRRKKDNFIFKFSLIFTMQIGTAENLPFDIPTAWQDSDLADKQSDRDGDENSWQNEHEPPSECPHFPLDSHQNTIR